MPVWAFRIADGRTLLAAIAPEDAQSLGSLPEIAIVGSVRGELSPTGFTDNPAFVRLLHDVVRRVGPADLDLHGSGAQAEGFVYVLDGRTPTPTDAVPPKDVIGAFPLREGTILFQEYRPNPNHRLFTDRGVTRPSATVIEALRSAIRMQAGLP